MDYDKLDMLVEKLKNDNESLKQQCEMYEQKIRSLNEYCKKQSDLLKFFEQFDINSLRSYIKYLEELPIKLLNKMNDSMIAAPDTLATNIDPR